MTSLQRGLALTVDEAERILDEWLRHPVTCTEITRLNGGMVNSVFRLEFDPTTPPRRRQAPRQ